MTATSDDKILIMRKEFFIGNTIAEVMPKEVSKLAYENLNLVFETSVFII